MSAVANVTSTRAEDGHVCIDYVVQVDGVNVGNGVLTVGDTTEADDVKAQLADQARRMAALLALQGQTVDAQ